MNRHYITASVFLNLLMDISSFVDSLGQVPNNPVESLIKSRLLSLEKELGKDDGYTLLGKHWLGRTLYGQKKCGEAEGVLRQAVQWRENEPGIEHVDTLVGGHLLQELRLAFSPPVSTNDTTEILTRNLSAFFPDGSERCIPYTDSLARRQGS
jgi:hypothetical protein